MWPPNSRQGVPLGRGVPFLGESPLGCEQEGCGEPWKAEVQAGRVHAGFGVWLLSSLGDLSLGLTEPFPGLGHAAGDAP